MSDKISIPVAEYVALNNKALMLDMIIHWANGAKFTSDIEEFVKFVSPFVHDATFAEAVAAEYSNDNF